MRHANAPTLRAARPFLLVTVVVASAGAALGCSSSSPSSESDAATAPEASAQGPDGSDAGNVPDSGGTDVAVEAGPDCGYPATTRDPACPATYSGVEVSGQPCSPIGLTCSYPGAGDGTSSGCFATAMMWCRADGGDGGGEDGGPEGGEGSWVAAQ